MFAGIDLGTTFTAAAVVDRSGRPEMINLGASSSAIPSVLLMRADGTMATGRAALQAAGSEPTRLVKEFKRRIGDPAPILVGGTPMAAHLLFGRLMQWVMGRITEREGGTPERLAITHPANWGEYKRDYLRQAVEHADLECPWITLSEPEAAAIYYASRERIAVGDHVAVYDLGGGTFDAAVLKRTEDSFEIVGEPMGLENLGGIDFDEAVFDYVRSRLPDEFDALDPDDEGTLAALQRLHGECETAKITLSSETETSIPVILPRVSASVRLTREEFEGLIRTTLEETVAALNRALRSAGVEAEDLAKVLLVGGSSRIPLVAQLIGEALGRPVAVDADPKNAIALGAALAAREAQDDSGAATAPIEKTAVPVAKPAAGGKSRAGLIVGGVIAAVAVIATVVVLSSGGGGGGEAATTLGSTTTAAPEESIVEAEALIVPDLADQTEADALFALGQAGFGAEQVQVVEIPTDEVAGGAVISTDPAFGLEVAAGEFVTVFVAVPVVPETTTTLVTTTTEPTVFVSAPAPAPETAPNPNSTGGTKSAQPGGSGCVPGFTGSGPLPTGTWAGFLLNVGGFEITIDLICYFDGGDAIQEAADNNDAELIDGVVVTNVSDNEFTGIADAGTVVLELVGPGEFVERTLGTWSIDCFADDCAVWVMVDADGLIIFIQEQEIPT